MNYIPGTGAEHSLKDPRTVVVEPAVTTIPLVKGGIDYLKTDIDHQHVVGICTAISRTQLRSKQTGKKYSPEFQYLLQKKFYDLAWFEGSSILYANKVAKNYGFLPAELWTHTTEQDRLLPYSQYAKKLENIPDEEIYRLIDLCVDPIAGYASVNILDPQAVGKAINESINQAGILCRYDCGMTWWTPSWLAKDINPLRKPDPATSGHAIIMSKFDYSTTLMQKLANTWGTTWCLNGSADINYANYRMTEAWIDLVKAPEIKYIFTKTLRYKSSSDDVKQLQLKLNILGFDCGIADGKFGTKTLKAVKNFQAAHNLKADGIVGPRTNEILNTL